MNLDQFNNRLPQPSDQVPIHPIYGIPDADDPPGAIDWPRFREEFKRFRSNQPFADDHPKSGESSMSSLSFGPVLPDNLLSEWRSRFREVERVRMRQGVKIEWRIVEGFLLYYEPEITQALDLSMFLRSPERVLKRRRQEREYVCSDGTPWVDPPGYWDQITYPAYIRGHSHLFHNGDVDWGTPVESFDLMVLDGEGTDRNLSFEEFFTSTASAILRVS
ncbi:ribosylnicotinamide kinase [Ceratobasidium sp. UAMH 11750]|nr:ribosylnicotinamide kinase [Ceratobasidium sp. UAMH 11750]